MKSAKPTGYFNQTYTIEFLVPGDLDGSTPNPPIQAPARTHDPQGFYRPKIEGNLGIIDADYVVPTEGPYGASGNRYIGWFWLESPVEGSEGATLEVIDAVDGSVTTQETLADLSGLTTYYRSAPFLIPQGSVLRISGFENDTGTPIKIRLHVSYLTDSGLIAAQSAICCYQSNITPIPPEQEEEAFAFNAALWPVPTDGTNAAPTINELLQTASAVGQRTRENQRIIFPAGTYTYSSDIIIPANVDIWGVGPGTRFQQRNGAEILFDTGFLRSNIQYLQIIGQSQAAPSGRGLVFSTAQMCSLKNAQIWFFETGIVLADGSLYSAHHQIGPNVEVNACPVGILAGPHGNANRLETVRVFYSFTSTGEGIALDVDSSVLDVSNFTNDSADISIRARNNGPTSIRFTLNGAFVEPGTNPDTLEIGTAFDIDVPNDDIDEPIVNLAGIYRSANSGIARLDPEGFHYFDAPTHQPYGARYSGSGGPKRNLVRNGMFNYFNSASVPGLDSTVAPTPSFNQEQGAGDFFTGVRSIRFTATGVGGSRGMVFQASDDGSRWVTVGCRYRVPAGNTGFFFSGTLQGVSRQFADREETPDGEWREGWLSLPLDPSNPSRSGIIGITPDSVDGTGSVLIDEVWAVEGRYAVASTQYGERIEMLQAPITIYDQTLTGNGAFGPLDITNLPAVLGPPLADFAAAPYGVVGAIYRFIVETDSGAFGTALTTRHSIVPSIPAASVVIPAYNLWAISPQYSQVPIAQDIAIRDTTLGGVINAGNGDSTQYIIQVVAWILQ